MNEYIRLLKHYSSLSSSDPSFPLHLCAGTGSKSVIISVKDKYKLWVYFEEERAYIRGHEQHLRRIFVKNIATTQSNGINGNNKNNQENTNLALGGWIPDEEVNHCMICNHQFSIAKKKHHCRSCGNIICDKCSPDFRVIYLFESLGPQRVCLQCYWGQSIVMAYMGSQASPTISTILGTTVVNPLVQRSSLVNEDGKGLSKLFERIESNEHSESPSLSLSTPNKQETNTLSFFIPKDAHRDSDFSIEIDKSLEVEFEGSEADISTPQPTGSDDEDLNQELQNWRRFIAEGELLTASSSVIKKNCLGALQPRQLLLTDAPALLYIDSKTNVYKGQIPWDIRTPPMVNMIDSVSFEVVVPDRIYKFIDYNKGSKYWSHRIRMASEQTI